MPPFWPGSQSAAIGQAFPTSLLDAEVEGVVEVCRVAVGELLAAEEDVAG